VFAGELGALRHENVDLEAVGEPPRVTRCSAADSMSSLGLSASAMSTSQQ
jgi:hypothetical protein